MADVSGAAGGPGGTDGEGDMGAKYAKRSSGVRRSLAATSSPRLFAAQPACHHPASCTRSMSALCCLTELVTEPLVVA